MLVNRWQVVTPACAGSGYNSVAGACPHILVSRRKWRPRHGEDSKRTRSTTGHGGDWAGAHPWRDGVRMEPRFRLLFEGWRVDERVIMRKKKLHASDRSYQIPTAVVLLIISVFQGKPDRSLVETVCMACIHRAAG